MFMRKCINFSQAGDGVDSGDGILVRGEGPFVLRFVTDGLGPEEEEAGNNNNNAPPPAATDELGFAFDFALETSCPQVEEIVP